MWKKGLLVVLLISSMAMVCYAQGAQEGDEVPTVAVINKVQAGDPFLMKIQEVIEERGKELGLNIVTQAPSSHTRADEQLAIIEDFVAQNVDGIILLPNDSHIVAPAVRKAKDAGIPVITVDTAVYDVEVVTHIATDNVAATELAAEVLLEAVSEKNQSTYKVAMLEGEPGQQTAIDRKKGFTERMEQENNVEIVASLTGHWTTPGGIAAMEDILTANADLDGVFAAADMMGVGAAEVIRREDKVGEIKLVTFDGIPEGLELVRKGIAYADVAQNPTVMGEKGIEIMKEIIIDGVDPNSFPDFIDSGATVMTKDKL